ncbi:hypothetical protein [Lysobacter humi (ex Lee et al. 2017)]
MYRVPPPPEPYLADARSDEAQWQRATNEGWPERDEGRSALPPGAIAPAAALALAGNVVDFEVWRTTRGSSKRAAKSR